MITRTIVGEHLQSYLSGTINLDEIVDWAENALADAEFDTEDHDVLRDAVARIGLADVKTFGLTWEDVTKSLHSLATALESSLSLRPETLTLSSNPSNTSSATRLPASSRNPNSRPPGLRLPWSRELLAHRRRPEKNHNAKSDLE